jgi:hypothetical protein
MAIVSCLLLLTDLYPLWLARQANGRTSLLHAVGWAALAWASWVGVTALGALSLPGLEPARYVALGLTACAGVAVLGARRPGMVAWNFVLVGLLAVMLLPLAEHLLVGGPSLDTIWVGFLCGTLAVALLNYVPTRQAPAALLLAVGCGWEILALTAADAMLSWPAKAAWPGWLCVGLAPWAAYFCTRGLHSTLSDSDRLWHGFRDRFGLVWGQRLREQFNRAAAHAGWPVSLTWRGLRTNPGAAPPETAVRATLQALLKRFLAAEDD